MTDATEVKYQLDVDYDGLGQIDRGDGWKQVRDRELYDLLDAGWQIVGVDYHQYDVWVTVHFTLRPPSEPTEKG